MFDMRLNSHSRLNLILALLEAIEAGADEALMLDPQGYVSSCNATNFFWVRGGAVHDLHAASSVSTASRAAMSFACAASTACRCRSGDFTPQELAVARRRRSSRARSADSRRCARSTDERCLQRCPGPLTQRLRGLYDGSKDREASRSR